MLGPIAIAQDNQRRSAPRRAVFRIKEAANCGFYAEHRKVISRYQFSLSETWRIPPLDSDLRGEHREHPLEDLVLIAQIAIHRVREIQIACPGVGAGVAGIRPHKFQHDESVRLLTG